MSIEEIKWKGGLPKGIRRIFSTETGKVSFEVCAGVVGGQKIRRLFSESKFGSPEDALEAAKFWYASQRQEILNKHLRASNLKSKGIEAISEQLFESIENMEMATKASEKRILESFEKLEQRILESFESIIKAQRIGAVEAVQKLAHFVFISIGEGGQSSEDLFEDYMPFEKRELELRQIVAQAAKLGLDPVQVFDTGVRVHVKRLKKDFNGDHQS
jgi:hypothetical protein